MFPTTTASHIEIAVSRDDAELARATMQRVNLRILPFLLVLFVFNYVDRTNVAMAALQMKHDLRLTDTAYSFGFGIFFLGYVLFEVPSNIVLARVGARRWIARIVISWGIIASAMMLARTPNQFYALRLLLGIAEAGFYPGLLYYLSLWIPAAQRARALARFLIGIPVAAIIGNPLSGWLLTLDGSWGLHGWQWIFLVEGIPSVLLGFATLRVLTDRVEEAHWLSAEQRAWLSARLQRDDEPGTLHGVGALNALKQPAVWGLSALYLLFLMPYYAYISWSPLLIASTLQVSVVTTGLITGVLGFLTIGAMLVVSASSDRTGERHRHMAAMQCLVALGCLSAGMAPWPLARVAGLGLMIAGGLSFGAIFWCLPSRLLQGSAAATAIAFINSTGNAAGFAAPYMLGRIKDATGGTTVTFLVLATVACGAAVLSIVLGKVLFGVRRSAVSI